MPQAVQEQLESLPGIRMYSLRNSCNYLAADAA